MNVLLMLVACKKEACPISGSDSSPWATVAVGGDTSCALREDGSLQCWGGLYDESLCPPEEAFASVSVGELHACGLTTGGNVECWGTDTDGDTNAPSGSFDVVAAGESTSCASGSEGSRCWGNNDHGQADIPDETFVSLDLGRWHGCGVTSAGTLSCWGTPTNGVLSVPTLEGDLLWTHTDVGLNHSCGMVDDGSLRCWGGEGTAQYGQTEVVDVAYADVSAGGNVTCGLDTNHLIHCVGQDLDHIQTYPTDQVDDVAVGGQSETTAHGCVIVSGGKEIHCWGNNDAGQTDPPGQID